MPAARMHADEVHVDGRLVRRLLEIQFPQWSDLTLRRVESAGTDNVLYRLGRNMVVRLPRAERTSATLEKERRWLPMLARLLPLAVPVPLAHGAPGGGYPFPWSVYTWLPGRDATRARVVDTAQLALDLGSCVRVLRQIDPAIGPVPGEHNAFRGVPLATRDARTRSSIELLRDSIDVGAVTAAWESALCAPAWEHAPVWIHGDLDPRNLLVDAGRLSAVIDWGCLGVGDPACDVMVAWKALPAPARELFRAELEVDEPTWERARGWALSQALNALSYYTMETNPGLVLEARRWLDEVLSDRAST